MDQVGNLFVCSGLDKGGKRMMITIACFSLAFIKQSQKPCLGG